MHQWIIHNTIYTMHIYKIDRVNLNSIVASVYCKSSANSTIAFRSEHVFV